MGHSVSKSLRAAACCATILAAIGADRQGLASAASPPPISLAQLPQCAGVAQGTVHQFAAHPGVVAVEPPADFNPLTATPSALACYGFPSRPADASELSRWQDLVSHAQHYVTPVLGDNTGPAFPDAGTVCSSGCSHGTWYGGGNYPWAGYGIAASHNGWSGLQWNEINGEWNVPGGHTYSACHNSSTGAADAAWLGLGGDGWDSGTGTSLIQAGTDTLDWSPVDITFFWENYNYNGVQTVSTPSVSAGDRVYVDVNYTGSSSTNIYFLNSTTNNYNSISVYTPNVDLSSAEAINEDNANGFSAINFGSSEFFSPEAYGVWGGTNSIHKLLSDTVTLSKFTAYTSSSLTNPVATPGSIDASGDFTVSANATNDTC